MLCRRLFRSPSAVFARPTVQSVSIRWFSAEAAAQETPKEQETAKEEVKSSEKKVKQQRKPKKIRFDFKLGPVNIHEALELAIKHKWAKFDESVEITIRTGLDPRKANQTVKGVARLPNGSGKKLRIAVLCSGNDRQLALEAGADVAGGEELIAAIQGGDTNFTTIIATPDMMPQVGKIGRILGPRGLMPNPKLGTVTKDVTKAVRSAKTGSVQFKTDKKGLIQAGVGKISFSTAHILENIRSFMISVLDNKPEGFKGTYLKRVYLSTTMGPGIELEQGTVDPSHGRFMLDFRKLTNVASTEAAVVDEIASSSNAVTVDTVVTSTSTPVEVATTVSN